MKWIHKGKGKFHKQGNRIVTNFVERAWNENAKRYVNCDYDSLKKERRMERLLLEQQRNHCCYCMRTVHFKQHTTLEHVIPHHSPNADCVEWYQKRYPRLRKNVMYYHVSERPDKKITVPPYPHFCAYDNLVVSCDGSIPDPNRPDITLPSKLHLCCNNARGNKTILPLFFIRKIGKEIIYETDGELTYNEHKYRETIQTLNLEHKTLKLMRRTWANIVKGKHFSIEDVHKAIYDKALREQLLEDSLVSTQDAKVLRTDIYWNTLYSYSWFYGYFKRKLYR